MAYVDKSHGDRRQVVIERHVDPEALRSHVQHLLLDQGAGEERHRVEGHGEDHLALLIELRAVELKLVAGEEADLASHDHLGMLGVILHLEELRGNSVRGDVRTEIRALDAHGRDPPSLFRNGETVSAHQRKVKLGTEQPLACLGQEDVAAGSEDVRIAVDLDRVGEDLHVSIDVACARQFPLLLARTTANNLRALLGG